MIAVVRLPFSRSGRASRLRAPGDAAGEPLTVTAADGVRLNGILLPGPAVRTFVLAHGMSHSILEPSTRRVIAALSSYGSVVALDFRGHGRSGGLSSVGGDEIHDIDAAVGLARSITGSHPVTTIGFSMGGSVVLRQAALGAQPPDLVVAVSSPSRWFLRESVPMRRVHWMLEHPFGPRVGRWAGIRVGEPWDEVPLSPLETIGQISQPLLLVQGDADPYFSPAQAIALHRASDLHAELWLEAGMGHAESGASDELIDRIAGWVSAHDGTGAAPDE